MLLAHWISGAIGLGPYTAQYMGLLQGWLRFLKTDSPPTTSTRKFFHLGQGSTSSYPCVTPVNLTLPWGWLTGCDQFLYCFCLLTLKKQAQKASLNGTQQGEEWYCSALPITCLFSLSSCSAQCHSMEGLFYFLRQCLL